jgi:hypothetical protein
LKLGQEVAEDRVPWSCRRFQMGQEGVHFGPRGGVDMEKLEPRRAIATVAHDDLPMTLIAPGLAFDHRLSL